MTRNDSRFSGSAAFPFNCSWTTSDLCLGKRLLRLAVWSWTRLGYTLFLGGLASEPRVAMSVHVATSRRASA